MSTIKSAILFKNKKGNRYFYDTKKKKLTLCHPLLFWIIQKHESGQDVLEWSDKQKGDPIDIEEVGMFTRNEINYYIQKFLLLKENGYFSVIDNKIKKSAILQPADIESLLANINDITFEVTDQCNLRCEYCGYGKFYQNYDKRENKNLDISMAKKTIDFLVKKLNSPLNTSHQRKLSIGFYGGEPLVNFSFVKKIVGYVNRLNLVHNEIEFNMTTNGLLLQKHMDFLAKHNFRIMISLDGDEKNNGYRIYKNGRTAFKDIFRNVKSLQQKYPDYFKKRVTFNAVLHNKNSIQDLYIFFHRHFSKSVSISSLNVLGIVEEKKDEFKKMFKDIYVDLSHCQNIRLIEKRMFEQLPHIRELRNLIQFGSMFVFNDYNDFFLSPENTVEYPTGTCLPFSKRIFITVNGKILPCERVGQDVPLGKVNKGEVDIDGVKISENYNKYYQRIREKCHSCYLSSQCPACIYYLNDFPDIKECLEFMDYKSYADFLSLQINDLEKNPHFYAKIIKSL